ncbi:MAG TPA: hypothetical protein VFY14_02520, partial [Streptomyces sp.]|nr:hypothetical protein [Streptomyces sp.]
MAVARGSLSVRRRSRRLAAAETSRVTAVAPVTRSVPPPERTSPSSATARTGQRKRRAPATPPEPSPEPS